VLHFSVRGVANVHNAPVHRPLADQSGRGQFVNEAAEPSLVHGAGARLNVNIRGINRAIRKQRPFHFDENAQASHNTSFLLDVGVAGHVDRPCTHDPISYQTDRW